MVGRDAQAARVDAARLGQLASEEARRAELVPDGAAVARGRVERRRLRERLDGRVLRLVPRRARARCERRQPLAQRRGLRVEREPPLAQHRRRRVGEGGARRRHHRVRLAARALEGREARRRVRVAAVPVQAREVRRKRGGRARVGARRRAQQRQPARLEAAAQREQLARLRLRLEGEDHPTVEAARSVPLRLAARAEGVAVIEHRRTPLALQLKVAAELDVVCAARRAVGRPQHPLQVRHARAAGRLVVPVGVEMRVLVLVVVVVASDDAAERESSSAPRGLVGLEGDAAQLQAAAARRDRAAAAEDGAVGDEADVLRLERPSRQQQHRPTTAEQRAAARQVQPPQPHRPTALHQEVASRRERIERRPPHALALAAATYVADELELVISAHEHAAARLLGLRRRHRHPDRLSRAQPHHAPPPAVADARARRQRGKRHQHAARAGAAALERRRRRQLGRGDDGQLRAGALLALRRWACRAEAGGQPRSGARLDHFRRVAQVARLRRAHHVATPRRRLGEPLRVLEHGRCMPRVHLRHVTVGAPCLRGEAQLGRRARQVEQRLLRVQVGGGRAAVGIVDALPRPRLHPSATELQKRRRVGRIELGRSLKRLGGSNGSRRQDAGGERLAEKVVRVPALLEHERRLVELFGRRGVTLEEGRHVSTQQQRLRQSRRQLVCLDEQRVRTGRVASVCHLASLCDELLDRDGRR